MQYQQRLHLLSETLIEPILMNDLFYYRSSLTKILQKKHQVALSCQ